MKPGVRALGIAESYRSETSTLAGVVSRANRVVDGFVFGRCTVGGTDATTAMIDMVDRLDRQDVRYLFVAGIAPAWYNIVDLSLLSTETGLPVVAVSFEESAGLEPALRDAFEGDELADRIERYRSLPERERVVLTDNGEQQSRAETAVFVRAVGLDVAEVTRILQAFTPEGGRPEPLRLARLAARAADQSPPSN